MAIVSLLSGALLLAMPAMRVNIAARTAHEIAAEVGEDLELGLMLITTARYESHFNPQVESCVKLGDDGAAYGRYQLHSYWFGEFTAAEVCKSTKLQTRLAAEVFRHLRKFGLSAHKTLCMYIGNVKEDDLRVKYRLQMFDKLVEYTRNPTVEVVDVTQQG